ncbi:unnamed protein product [Danaus chrysippus]|uniref:(African queen) hypothetical protein n=1 Tax=Danaus chrysippus TaxID=151541 RepID=A0A8J2W5N4_9NEOP|nr:unnamed protein product [Danaus chrysippus]
MLLRISVLIAVSLYGSCMEMRETVERMVMVRTSGSDLQPAATGYIYKKKNDGEESVIKMGESEVMEQLSKYYKQPKIADKNSANIKDGSKEDRIIPVSEESDEKVDGLHDDDFKKIFEKYGVKFDDHDGHDHYPHDFNDYYGYGGNKDNKKLYDNYKKHYGDSGSGDYHNEKYSSYTHSHKGNGEKESDENNKYNNEDDKLNKEEKSDAHNEGNIRFQKAYEGDQKGRKLYDNDDGVKFAFYKYGGSKYYGDDAGHKHDDSHESGDSGKAHEEIHGAKDSAEEQGDKKQEYYKSDGGKTYGNGYGFKINH